MATRYLVQEFVAKRWWTIRSFDNAADAKAFAATRGYGIRIKAV